MLAVINVCSLKKYCSSNKKACTLLRDDIHKLNIEICAVTETFLRPSVPDSFITISGFNNYRRDRQACNCRRANCPKAHKGGGILIYVHTKISSEIFDISTTCESLWIKILQSPESTDNPIFINASYHPPSLDSSALLHYLSTTTNRIDEDYPKSTVIICGDFNRIDLENLEIDCGLFILDSPPTRGTARLDLVMSNRPDIIEDISTFKSQVDSDHLGLLIKPKWKTKPRRKICYFRLYSFRGHQQLNSLLSSFDFQALYNMHNIHDAAVWLDKNIYWCFDNAFPIKRVQMSDKDPYWFTPKVKWLLNQKKLAKRRKNFKKVKHVDTKIKDQKLRLVLSKQQKGTSRWWGCIDSLTHRKVTSNNIVEEAFEPDNLNHELSQRSALSPSATRQPSPSFNLAGWKAPQLSTTEVAQVMKNCKRTSSGPCNIPYFIYREYWDILAPLYHHLWNLSLENGTFPDSYKAADLIPVPKKRNAKHADDIRGISITSISSRLFEKAVHRKWIAPRITSIGDPHQFAYKQNSSTVDCLLCIQHHTLHNLDHPDVDGVHAILLDYSKAFDRVNQEKAAEQYDNFIESPHIKKWLYEFSTGRQQRLLWKGKPLSFLSIERGCSQGTVGGPGLFSMFTDDCRAIHRTSRVFKYSDDTTCLSICRKQPTNDEKTILDYEIKNLVKYAENKELIINVQKSKFMRFCLNRHPFCQCEYNVDTFETVTDMKILGVIFQSNCTFQKHCRRLVCDLRRLLYILIDLKLNGVPLDNIHLIFDSLIISRVRYGLSVYGSDSTSLRKIDRFLERCYEKNFCKSRFYIFNLLQEEDLRNLRRIQSDSNHPLHNYLSSFKKDRTTRHGFTSTRPYVRTKAFHQAFGNRVLAF